jgi:hypothetical protein
MADIKRINTRAQLQELASELGVLPDWHEPNQSGVDALVSGHMLDNAGFWGVGGTGTLPSAYQELWVTITQKSDYDGNAIAVAEVNLAMLLAWSCGYEEEPRRATGGTTTARPGSQEASDVYRSHRNRLRGGK